MTPAAERLRAHALEPDGPWNAVCGRSAVSSAAGLEHLSAADCMAMTGRRPAELARTGRLRFADRRRLPAAAVRLAAAQSIDLDLDGVAIDTCRNPRADCDHRRQPYCGDDQAPGCARPSGRPQTCAARPRRSCSWRSPATACSRQAQVLGNPRRPHRGLLHPTLWPAIDQGFVGGGARSGGGGPGGRFTYAIDQRRLFGSDVRGKLQPLVASSWCRMTHVRGAYSYALPGHAAARTRWRAFERRLFFAGGDERTLLDRTALMTAGYGPQKRPSRCWRDGGRLRSPARPRSGAKLKPVELLLDAPVGDIPDGAAAA